MNGDLIRVLPVNSEAIFEDSIPEFITIHAFNGGPGYFALNVPGVDKKIGIGKDSLVHTENIADSLLNALDNGTLKFLNQHYGTLRGFKSADSLKRFMDEFIEERDQDLETYSGRISADEFKMLSYYNHYRIYTFMILHMGMAVRNLDPSDPYFDMIRDIPEYGPGIRSLPVLTLIAYKIRYVRQFGKIVDVGSFLDYVGRLGKDRSENDFMKAIAIEEIVKHPEVWPEENVMLTSGVFHGIMRTEVDNPYYNTMLDAYFRFKKLEAGAVARNFKGVDRHGDTIQLKDLKGKILLIDLWATWCAPCLRERPNVLELANTYKDDPDVAVITISLDAKKENWENFLENNSVNPDYEILIENGMDLDFGENYSVSTIPRYMVIDKEGKILEGYLDTPEDFQRLLEN
ncbi:hypothetical protein DMZ48_02590 [Robertkochia solimangrovi]|nr:hypothetical protein DMZ48_02590 [Robertkochia solimangrovi]